MNQKIRVAIFWDEDQLSKNFYNLLSQSDKLHYAGKFTSTKEVLPKIQDDLIDVLFIDSKLILKGNELLRQLRARNKKLIIIGIIDNELEIELDKILMEEIQGYVLSPYKLETILQAIQVCSLGGIFLSENVKGKFFKILSEKYLNIYELNLTPREKQIASLYCEGFTYKQIAEKLYISPQTVRTHLKKFHCKFKNAYLDQSAVKNKHKLLKVKRNKK
ncbi:MAG: Two-component response regulator [Ignavibacteriae bacterium]|nr:MAG: Two-component response regulator [Ignavibacteriota bacterium]